jgi:hypothetical protein
MCRAVLAWCSACSPDAGERQALLLDQLLSLLRFEQMHLNPVTLGRLMAHPLAARSEVLRAVAAVAGESAARLQAAAAAAAAAAAPA